MIFGYAFSGFETILVSVEVDISVTLPSLEVVGLPASEVKEARERVKTAVRNSGYVWPNKKVLVNLAPSDVKKRGAGLDLPIALAILQASGQIPAFDFPIMALGELRLDGAVRPVRNALASVICAVNGGVRHFIVSHENADDVLCVRSGVLCSIGTLADAKHVPKKDASLSVSTHSTAPRWCVSPGNAKSVSSDCAECDSFCDSRASLRDLSYCDELKRCVQIAAAGRHSILLCGVPGTGKTAAAARLPTFLPALTYEQSLEVSNIYAGAGLLSSQHSSEHAEEPCCDAEGALIRYAPVRQPHHSASLEAMIGSAATRNVGEVSLAHRGVLILDEAPEFKAKVLQALREPMDTRRVNISSAEQKIMYPAGCLFVFTCNLCPCGNRGKPYILHNDAQKRDAPPRELWHGSTACMCSEQEVFRYWKRIGGALWDRIDIKYKTGYRSDPGDCAAAGAKADEPLIDRIKDITEKQRQVARALTRQQERYAWQHESQGGVSAQAIGNPSRAQVAIDMYNGYCRANDIGPVGMFTDSANRAARHATARVSDRLRIALLRVSRTVADLHDEDSVHSAHVDEACFYVLRGM